MQTNKDEGEVDLENEASERLDEIAETPDAELKPAGLGKVAAGWHPAPPDSLPSSELGE